jgi:hypothetical protein
MSAWFDDFLPELYGAIKQAWPEIVLPGWGPATVFTSLQAYKRNFVEDAARNAGVPGLEPPYVVVAFGRKTPEPDMSLGPAGRYRLPVSVFYVGTLGVENQRTLHAKLETLRDLIDAPDASFRTFQPWERGLVDSSEESPANQALHVRGQAALIAGNVTWSPGFLVADLE